MDGYDFEKKPFRFTDGQEFLYDKGHGNYSVKRFFRTIRTWEDARTANAFLRHIRKQLSDPSKDWSLEARDINTWVLDRKINEEKPGPVILSRAEGY